MARKPATEEQKQKARRRLQKAAAKLYREEGLSGISARRVAERAGVSVGTIYSYFGTLQALMQSLWMEPVARIDARFRAVSEETPDPVERLKALLAAYADFALRNPELYRGAFLFVRPEKEARPERAELKSAVFPALLVAAIEEGQAKGTIKRGDPERLAQILWAGLHGALALPVNIDRLAFDRPAALAGDMIDLLVGALT